MNNYFTNINTHLKLKPTKINPKGNLKSIINIFQNHESVRRIKLANFSVSELEVKKDILNFSSRKATWYSSQDTKKTALTLTYQN